MSSSPIVRRLDSPLATAAVTGVLCLIFVVARFAALDWDVSSFVQAGSRFVDTASAPPGLTVSKGTGFDGQFFYRLALDPVSRERVAHGIELDIPALRQQRILYPALVWLVSGGGRAGAIPWALLAVNLAGVVALGALTGAFARATGRHALWGLVLSLYPGFAVTLGLDLAEILATVLVLGGLLLIRRGRSLLAGVSLAGAVLTRETALIVVLGVAVVWLVDLTRRRAQRVSLAVFAPPIAAYAAMQAWLWARWEEPALASGGAVNIGIPFRKLASEASAWSDQGAAFAAYHWLLLGATAFFLAAVLLSLRSSTAMPHEKAGFVIAAILVPFLAGTIWLHYWASLRALTELYALGAIVLVSRPNTRIDRLAVVTGALWLSTVLNMTVAASRLAPPSP
jgi:hypothetical protein